MKKTSQIDPAIAAALKASAAPEYDTNRLTALAARIESAARPIFDQRRLAARGAHWWDVAAEWAGMLIPAGVTVAAASIALLWFVRPAASNPIIEAGPPATSGRTVILGAAGAGGSKPDLVSYAVEQVIAPPVRVRSSGK